MGEVLVFGGADVLSRCRDRVVHEAVGEHGDENAARCVVEPCGGHAAGELTGCELDAAGAEPREVHARLGGGYLVVAGPEVRDGVTLKAEAGLDVVEEGGALGGEGPVDLGIGHHDRGGGRGGDDAAEGRLVDLVHRAVGHQGVAEEAVHFLGVGREVLDRGRDLTALHAGGEGGAEAAREERVFSQALGLAPEVPGPRQIDGRPEEAVVPLGASLGADGDPDTARQVLVEGGGLGEGDRERGDVLFATQPGGGVDHGEGGDTEVAEGGEVAPDEGVLVGSGHPGEKSVGAVEGAGIGRGDGLTVGGGDHADGECGGDGGGQEGASVHGGSPRSGAAGGDPSTSVLPSGG